MLGDLEVNREATEASSSEREMPACAHFRACRAREGWDHSKVATDPNRTDLSQEAFPPSTPPAVHFEIGSHSALRASKFWTTPPSLQTQPISQTFRGLWVGQAGWHSRPTDTAVKRLSPGLWRGGGGGGKMNTITTRPASLQLTDTRG